MINSKSRQRVHKYYAGAKKRFLKGSFKYFISAGFFPREQRIAVTSVYNFCRYLDDIADINRDLSKLENVHALYIKGMAGESISDPIIQSFVEVSKQYCIRTEWVDAMVSAMRSELQNKQFITLEDTLEWTYGVAEVVGLFMSRILGLPTEADKYAKLLGRAAQWSNNIRDIHGDLALGRSFFPNVDYERFGIPTSAHVDAITSHPKFQEFINLQLDRYDTWQVEAQRGFAYIPKNYLYPIEISNNIDLARMNLVIEDPNRISQEKIMLSKIEMVSIAIKTYLSRAVLQEGYTLQKKHSAQSS